MFSRIGVYRERKDFARCGLCGDYRQMTEAHVPPQACGNKGPLRERAQWVQGPGGSQLSKWKSGGLSVYGLCAECNRSTSDGPDRAYIDFHFSVMLATAPKVRQLLIEPKVPPVAVAPRLVAHSVLAGMFALNDTLQERFPDLATGLRQDSNDLRLPDGLELRLALTSSELSRIGGPVGYAQVLQRRRWHMPLAEVWFPPLAWCLCSTTHRSASLGPELSEEWCDVSAWPRHGRELVTDLRNVSSSLPAAAFPRLGAGDWVILTGDNAMTVLEGRPRPSP
ncbi:hypothetical protein [Pseudokineococcus sp. 1T1Z-3]|uniref:hypothetical protein n=1 Tax=Pseudokineococcus sp. 1T1Z-3 TaxID=3132745 RepID=UPI0030AB1150